MRRARYTRDQVRTKESVLAAQSRRSIANMVFVVILVALIVGIGDLALHMTQTAMSGPTDIIRG